ncbi:MAG: DNA translocase FtsK 4TM domain-containing protein [Planctomycetota bacterium]
MFEDRSPKFDVVALALGVVAMLVAISLASYDPADLNAWGPTQPVRNACGVAGARVAHAMVAMLGVGAYYAAGSLGVVAMLLLSRRRVDQPVLRTTGWAMSLVGISTLAATLLPHWTPGPMVGAGGYLGAMAQTALAGFATTGTVLIAGAVLLAGLLLATDYFVFNAAAAATVASGTTLVAAGQMSQTAAERLGVRRSVRRTTDLDNVGVEGEGDEADDEVEDEWEDEEVDEAENDEQDDWEYEEENSDEAEEELPVSTPTAGKLAGAAAAVGGMIAGALGKKASADEQSESSTVDSDAEDNASPADGEETPPAKSESVAVKKPKAKSEREQIIESLEAADHDNEFDTDYELPPIDLLLPTEDFSYEQHEKEVRRKAKVLEKTFQSFNLNVKVVEVETGPVISQYEVELEPGLRLSKITGLADDLAIALRAPSVRIVAPIPGKNTVGIEAPNDTRQVVRLREVIEETDGQARRMKIPIFLGKDVAGNPMVVDMAALPHLLIAGRTGTGKSVCLNSIITSILMTRGPDEVRMLMIDPKMVELSGYRKLPHLMHPVVTDMKKAEAILAWSVDKMEERYTLLAKAGVRHVSTYNQLTEDELRERLEAADGEPMDEATWSLVPKQQW